METLMIGSAECKLHATAAPAFILIQPTARHEEKGDGLRREMLMTERDGGCRFVMAAFDTGDWARALMPWADSAVSREAEVGRHADDTLHYVTQSLLPWLRRNYGELPCIIGGYSLGGLFALWTSTQTDAFSSVAAASPSLWIDGWHEHSMAHPTMAQSVYLSLGDCEEHCRNQRMKLIGDRVREEHLLLRQRLGDDCTTLEWNSGGHFGQEAERTARAFAWCMRHGKALQTKE